MAIQAGSKGVYGARGRKAGVAEVSSESGERYLPWFVGLIAFFIYLRTMTPGMQLGDGTELAAAAAVLGVPHPTGYPFYTMLGWVWSHVLPGDAITNLTLLNAALMATAVGFTSIILRDLLAAIWGAATDKGALLMAGAGALTVGFLRFHWSNAVVTEVYGLQFLLMVLFTRAAQLMDKPGQGPMPLLVATVCLAVGIAHHRLSVTMILPCAALWWLAWRRSKSLNSTARLPWATAVAILLGGTLLYVYIPLRAAQHPAINWGDAVTVSRVYNHVRGTEYLDRGLLKPAMGKSYSGSTFARFAELQTAHLLTDAVGQLAPIGEKIEVIPGAQKVFVLGSGGVILLGLGFTIAAAWGLWLLRRRGEGVTAGIIAAVAVQNLAVLYVYNIVDIRDYFLYPLWALWVGMFVAMAGVIQKISGEKRTVAGYAAFALPVLVLAGNWSRCNASRDVYAEQLSAVILPDDTGRMAPGSILITDDDSETFTTWYRQRVRGERTDVLHFAGNFVYMPWYRAFFTAEQWKEYSIALASGVAKSAGEYADQVDRGIIAANIGAHAVYTTINDPAVLQEFSRKYKLTRVDSLQYINRGLFDQPAEVVLYSISQKDSGK